MIIGISGKIGSGKDTAGLIIQWMTSPELQRKFITCKDYVKTASRIGLISMRETGFENDAVYKIKKFADPLKDCICIILGCERCELEDVDFKNKKLTKDWANFSFGGVDLAYYSADIESRIVNNNYLKFNTVRSLLQKFGTEAARKVHNDIWINALFSNYVPFRSFMCDECMTSNILEIEEPDTCPVCGYCSEGNLTMVLATPDKWVITDVRFENEVKAIKRRGGIVIRLTRDTGNKPSNHESETALDYYDEFDLVYNNNGSLDDLISFISDNISFEL